MVVSEIYSRAALMQIGMKCLEKEVFLCTMYMCILHKKLLVVIVHKLCTGIYIQRLLYVHVRTQCHKLASVGYGVHCNNKRYI